RLAPAGAGSLTSSRPPGGGYEARLLGGVACVQDQAAPAPDQGLGVYRLDLEHQPVERARLEYALAAASRFQVCVVETDPGQVLRPRQFPGRREADDQYPQLRGEGVG